MANVKTGLADVLRKLEAGEIDSRRANALIYGYATLTGVIRGSEIANEIAELKAEILARRSRT